MTLNQQSDDAQDNSIPKQIFWTQSKVLQKNQFIQQTQKASL